MPPEKPRPHPRKVREAILLPVTLFVVLGFTASGTFYVLASRSAVRDAVERLVAESSANVESRLSRLFMTPQNAGMTIAEFVQRFDDSSAGSPILESVFRALLEDIPNLNIVAVGFSSGEYTEAHRIQDGTIEIGRAGRATGGALEIWTCDGEGALLELKSSRPGYDPRSRPWYQKAAQTLRPGWSEIYPYFSDSDLAIAAGIPMLAGDELKGVVTVTVTLRGVSAFLDSFPQSRTGVLAVVDMDGSVVAVSGGSPAAEPQNELVLRAIRALADSIGGPITQVRFKAAGKRYVAGSSLLSEENWGIRWRVISILPESEFTSKLAESDLRGSLIFILLLAVALILGWLAVDGITEPLHHLEIAVTDLANERLTGGSVGIVRALAARQDEIGHLASSFEYMRRRLSEDFETLRMNLQEKDVLLKEVHHRVKNNLQIVSSMLSIQSGEISDPSAREAFSVCQERIQAMAFVHEGAYQTGTYSEVNMGDYLRRIGDFLRLSRIGESNPVEIRVDAEDVRLTVARAIPCGLIVNELAVNALKHAFPEGRSGIVRISMSVVGDEFVLIVEDDGVGLAEGTSAAGRAGIGRNLIHSLVSQLRGRMDCGVGSGGTGYRVEIHIKV